MHDRDIYVSLSFHHTHCSLMSESSGDEAVRRRKALIAKALAARAVALAQADAASSPSSSESELESDGPKPVFVPKAERVALAQRAEKERLEAEAVREREAELEVLRERQKQRALAEAQLEDYTEAAEPEWTSKPPPIGQEDTPEEYAKWKIREMKRILAARGEGEASPMAPKQGVFFQN